MIRLHKTPEWNVLKCITHLLNRTRIYSMWGSKSRANGIFYSFYSWQDPIFPHQFLQPRFICFSWLYRHIKQYCNPCKSHFTVKENEVRCWVLTIILILFWLGKSSQTPHSSSLVPVSGRSTLPSFLWPKSLLFHMQWDFSRRHDSILRHESALYVNALMIVSFVPVWCVGGKLCTE